MTNSISLPVPSVSLVNDQPATTSLAIAEHFGKDHSKILRDIRSLIDNCPESFNGANFGLVEYEDSKGEARPMYTVFFDGFILLAMGYTGKTALQIKLAYIQAFNAMRAELEQKAAQPVTECHQLPPVDAPITPDQQCTLRAIVKSKVEALPEEQRTGKGLYPQIWSRFNNHFRIASYRQLPQCRLSEAIEYLMQMDLTPQPKALPNGNSGPAGLEALIQLGYMPYDPSPISHLHEEDRRLDEMWRSIRSFEQRLDSMHRNNQLPPVPAGQDDNAHKLRETFLASCYVARRALGAMFEMGREARIASKQKALASA